MCGRYVIMNKLKIIAETFNADASEIMERFQINPNVSPGDEALVITDEDPQKLQLFTFGFTPFWAKKRMYVINARSEGDHNKENDPGYRGAKGIIKKPMWRKSIRSRRCLVIADAFVEGTEKERLSKPYLVYRVNNKRPFAMAGIWDEWVNKDTGEVVRSFAIITTAPAPLLQLIPHHRSPLILSQDDERLWLDKNLPLSAITELMEPFDDEEFNAYPISPDIKSSKNKDSEVLKPLDKWIRPEVKYVWQESIELQGMGETTARKRKLNEEH